MIKADALRKKYGKLVAVDGVSLELKPGETFGLLGPNGAGKTTTISMLAGLLKPDAGTVSIDGQEDPTRPEVRRRIGVAPQSMAVYQDLSGRENIEFFAKLHGLAGDRLKQRTDAALAFVGLADRQNDRPSTYSGGMARRLNLACAIVHDPPVLLLDEPTVGVDPQSRNAILENIDALKKSGKTILYTTHYMEEAQKLCDRVAIMDAGQVLALDTVPELIKRHGGHAYVEAELEELPVNGMTLPGELDGMVIRIDTDKPQAAIERLNSLGVKFVRLHIERPSLEDVFLRLTGKKLRD